MYEDDEKMVACTADRMGRFIGQLRAHENITLTQLAHGLCTPSFLGKIESGECEIGKQLTDALFQRLGKPVELFERILDWGEFQRWARRQEIITCLCRGELQDVRMMLCSYVDSGKDSHGNLDILDRQFAQIVEINCRFLSGAGAQELLPMVCDALALTQPDFQTTGLEDLLLTRNEGRLLFAWLRLREQTEGAEIVAQEYRALLRCFKRERYESRERVYLLPDAACRVIEHDFSMGRYASALAVCRDALEELTREKRLSAYDRLLAWEQKLLDAMGESGRMPEKLLAQLELIRKQMPRRQELLIPCDERGHVYCLNQVIRDRRRLLGITQKTLAKGICDLRTLSRIENCGGDLQKRNRKQLLQRVNMSGERYDYEVITDRYEDYLLRSELDRAITADRPELAKMIFSKLRQQMPDIPANRQYIARTGMEIPAVLQQDFPDGLSLPERERRLEDIIHLTLPLDLNAIDLWPDSVLSINELLSLLSYASCCRKQGAYEKCLTVLTYIKRCLDSTGADVLCYEDLYTRVCANIANVQSNLGLCDEAIALSQECIRISLESGNSRRLARYYYAIAVNIRAKASDPTAEDAAEPAKEMLARAYAMAIISGDVAGQRHICAYCLRIYGVEPEL